MPLFEYHCEDCHYRFEALVVGSRRPESCPACGSPKIEKQFSTFGLGSAAGSSSGYASRSSCGPTGGG